jgi:hypothetical protein
MTSGDPYDSNWGEWAEHLDRLLKQTISHELSGWLPEDLVPMYQHQLQAPLREELLEYLADAQAVLNEVDDPMPPTFGVLFEMEQPPLALLRLVKDYAKLLRSQAREMEYPEELATLLYFTTIAVAAVRCNESLSTLSADKLRAGFAWAQKQAYCPPAHLSLFDAALRKQP